MGNIISNRTSIHNLIESQVFFNKPTHLAPCIILPHQAFNGQEIPLSRAVKEKLNLSKKMESNNTYIENEEVWLSMFYFAIQNEYTELGKVENILTMDHNDKQAALIYSVIDDVMTHLETDLSNNQNELLAYSENKGVSIAPHLLNFAKNQFSTELTFGCSENYGTNDEVSLRLDGSFGLSVLTIDCLIHAPAPLQRIGGLLVRTLAQMSNKLISTNLIEFYNGYNEDGEVFSELTLLNKTEIKSLFLEDDHEEKIVKYIKESTTVDDHDLNMVIDDFCVDSFCSILLGQIDVEEHYDYLLYCESLDFNTADAIKQINNDFMALDASNNPVIAHPLYSHFKKIVNILNDKYIPINSRLSEIFDSGSDLAIEEHFVISLNTNLDGDVLDIHNDTVSAEDEIGSLLLDMNNDDLLPYLKNNTLSTILLLGIDV